MCLAIIDEMSSAVLTHPEWWKISYMFAQCFHLPRFAVLFIQMLMLHVRIIKKRERRNRSLHCMSGRLSNMTHPATTRCMCSDGAQFNSRSGN
jgi:hypothetical protein